MFGFGLAGFGVLSVWIGWGLATCLGCWLCAGHVWVGLGLDWLVLGFCLCGLAGVWPLVWASGYLLAWTGHVWVGLCGLAEGWWPWLVWVGVGELPGYGVCLCGLAGGCWPWLVWVGVGWSV